MGGGRSFPGVSGGGGGRGGPPPATHAGLSYTTRQCTHSSRHMLGPPCLPTYWPGATPSLGVWGGEPQATVTSPHGERQEEKEH